MMEIKLLCIFVVVTLGTAEYETNCIAPSICNMDPIEGEGRAIHRGWFYDYNIDACLVLSFGAPRAENEVVNRFETREQCSKTCRPHVKSFCFDDPPKTNRGPNDMWFYNSTQAKCIMMKANGQAPENANLFDTERKCKKTCRDPDYGPCAKRPPGPCKETDGDQPTVKLCETKEFTGVNVSRLSAGLAFQKYIATAAIQAVKITIADVMTNKVAPILNCTLKEVPYPAFVSE
ncbi:putative KUN-2 [Ixodes scapularis]